MNELEKNFDLEFKKILEQNYEAQWYRVFQVDEGLSDTIQLDGSFTSNQLREIGRILDQFRGMQ